MESLARFLVAAGELFEAEVLELKRQIARLILAAGLGVVILGLVVAGLGFLLAGLLRVLAETQTLTPTTALMAVGMVAILLAGGMFLYVRRLLRR